MPLLQVHCIVAVTSCALPHTHAGPFPFRSLSTNEFSSFALLVGLIVCSFLFVCFLLPCPLPNPLPCLCFMIPGHACALCERSIESFHGPSVSLGTLASAPLLDCLIACLPVSRLGCLCVCALLGAHFHPSQHTHTSHHHSTGGLSHRVSML